MNNTQLELEQFLTWFSKQEAIPLQTRRDFFRHMMEVGGIDGKAQQFIDTTLEQLTQKSERKAKVLRQKIDFLNAALEAQKVPELSLKEKIVTGVSSWMMEKAQNFKANFKRKEKIELQKEETFEADENQKLVDQLKASLA